jgi:hypothetical protein
LEFVKIFGWNDLVRQNEKRLLGIWDSFYGQTALQVSHGGLGGVPSSSQNQFSN